MNFFRNQFPMDEHTHDPVTDADASHVDATTACAKCPEYLEGWKRAQADYQNLRREMDRDRSEYTRYANQRLLEELLPAIDQYALALKHVPEVATLPDDVRKIWDNWLVGVRGVGMLWEQAAKQVGLQRVTAEGAFNPAEHEAVSEEAADGMASGTILRVIQDGWKLHEKVLRPAKVVVAK